MQKYPDFARQRSKRRRKKSEGFFLVASASRTFLSSLSSKKVFWKGVVELEARARRRGAKESEGFGKQGEGRETKRGHGGGNKEGQQ